MILQFAFELGELYLILFYLLQLGLQIGQLLLVFVHFLLPFGQLLLLSAQLVFLLNDLHGRLPLVLDYPGLVL